MLNDPTVLIVTPSLNQGAFIRDTIESVRQQDYPAISQFVVDGGSTDETLEILREYEGAPGFQWVSEPDYGQAHAIAKGFHQAGGEVIAWLNADDTYTPGAVRAAIRLLDEHPRALMAVGGVRLIDENGRRIADLETADLNLDDMLRLRRFIPQPGTFLRRLSFEKAGGLDHKLKFAFDFDLFLRLKSLGEVCYSSSIFACHRLHHESKTVSQLPKLRQEAAWVARRFITSGQFRGNPRRELLSRIDLVEAYAAYQLQEWGQFGWLLLRALARYPAHWPLLLDGVKRTLDNQPTFRY